MQLTLDARQLVDLLDQVDRQTNGAALVSHASGDGLANPPGRVSRELEALRVVELLHRADQTEVALLDEVEKRHSAARVALCQRDDEAQVGLEEVGACCLAFANDDREITLLCRGQPLAGRQNVLGVETCFDLLGELDLLLCVEQGCAADAVEVDTDQIRRR
ncbi:Uncharacterised protein [Mycobacteroides abscessus subsp. abscessus]|nr:Uncharacterised protein [Mycobacteroides abscessus subsp. abscessus]